jgi:alkylation response protein AidB-like acyl-CoA dehydrogenase
MRYAFTDTQRAFHESVRAVFRRAASPARLRELWRTDTGRGPELWADLCALGAPAVLVPEEHGGLGGTEVDLCLPLEESGRSGIPDALLEALVVGPALVAEGAPAEVRAELLPGIAAGELRVTVALAGIRYVPDAHVSDLIILERSGGVRLYRRAEVELTPVRSMDPSRRLFAVAPRPNTGIGLSAGGAALSRARARQDAGSAAVLCGLADQLLRLSVDYAKVRRQFGRPIGSFQGVKHQLAQATALVSLATQAERSATWLVARRSPDTADGTDAAEVAVAADAADAARLARVCAIEAEFEANRVALQTHGGIGFTFEHDLQIWLKRGKALEQAHGGHRELARRAGEAAVAGEHGVLSRQIAAPTPERTLIQADRK